MVNKPKNQGTAFETWLVNYWTDRFLTTWRLAEGGSHDEGDIRILAPDWTIEAKARANLNVTQTLAKAKAKAPADSDVAVVWKRLTRKGDNQRRSADGEPIVVILDLDTFTRLIGGQP